MTISSSDGSDGPGVTGGAGARRARPGPVPWLVAAALLSACAGGAGFGRSAPDAIAVTRDAVVIAGPPGFCVDESASREEAGGAFVLLGSCAAITNNPRDPRPGVPGVLTVTVSGGPAPKGALAPLFGEMASFVRTEEGRAALSRAGDAETVTVIDTRVRDGVLYIRARDTASRRVGIEADYWRALFGVKDRLLTVSVAGFEDAPMTREAGLRVLDSLAARIRAANGA